jgi:transposase
MRKIRDILRLKWELGLGLREIARSVSASHSTVLGLIHRAEAAGLTWPLPEDLDDAKLEALLYPGEPGQDKQRPEPDWDQVHRCER